MYGGPFHCRRQALVIEYTLQAFLQVLLTMGALPPIPTCAALLLLTALVVTSRVEHLQRSMLGRSGRMVREQQVMREAVQDLAQQRTRWVAALRGGLMMYTCTGILAVDFR
jgi:hypothetical protein